MNKILFIGLFFILLAITCQAQSKYSKQNLEQASTEDLNTYLNKAKKTKKIGAIMSIGGPIAFGSGIVLANAAWSGGTEAMWGSGLMLMTAGASSTLIGLPVLITGSSRIKRINKIKNPNLNEVTMELAPCSFNNCQAQIYQAGLTLRLRF